MVTCQIDTVSKMNNRPRRRGSSTSSGFRLLDGDQCDTMSSISRNSIYKQKIDLMFDDSRSIVSQRIGERSSIRIQRRISIRSGSTRSKRSEDYRPIRPEMRRVNNNIQEQIERMFTDVAKDATCTFPVRCLGALPLPEKVTSLQGLQEPLRQLYLSGAGIGNQNAGTLDICGGGLRVRLANGRDPLLTPFHNIAVWSAVKFVVSASDGGAAFLPLITDPENIDKSSLFQPLSAADKRRLSSGLHAPIVAIVMRSAGVPKQLECHGYVCQTPEDAIVIAATLYQSLMTHMENAQNVRTRKPRNQNGVSCISIASSSVTNLKSSQMHHLISDISKQKPPSLPSRPPRKKRSASNSLSGNSDIQPDPLPDLSTDQQSTTEERKKKSHKTKRAPPIPGTLTNSTAGKEQVNGDILTRVAIPRSGSFLNTGGLTRYKSRATRRISGGKTTTGGGSPLGFSELFNEFRLQENLHSLDEILNAIINSDGMSFNDLKPIYKEFLLKLAVTLTKDELYQRSKSIMRRQKKKKLRRKNSNVQNKRRNILGSKGLRKVFWFSRFRNHLAAKKKLQTNDTASLSHKKSNKIGASGSEVSIQRIENTLTGQNRNSSSGYVSCSECSYDSEACTCVSADRCYCSLGADHETNMNVKLRKNREKRDSLTSCHSEDKCYCSLDDNENDGGVSSTTEFCDSDSCISSSKCYCKRATTKTKKQRGYNPNNLALDYELFTVNGTGKQVKPHEALSVKKSVEMAAVFADVKLSQTTDITSLMPANQQKSLRRSSVDQKSETMRSRKKDVESIRSMNRRNSRKEDIYQPVISRPVSVTLEDSLGYLP